MHGHGKFSHENTAMSLNAMHKVVLRSLLRQANNVRKRNDAVWLQRFPSIEEFQSSTYSTPLEDLGEFTATFPPGIREFILQHTPSRVINGKDLRRIVLTGFRHDPLKGSLSELIECLKLVTDQVKLMESTSITFSEDVRVTATAVYDKREFGQLPGLTDDAYSFYYRISIENMREHPIRLVGRHWLFKSENIEQAVPKWASGVIGLNPTIYPGKIFQYMSMAHLVAERGTMEGAFLFECQGTKEPFEAKVGVCQLTTDVFATR